MRYIICIAMIACGQQEHEFAKEERHGSLVVPAEIGGDEAVLELVRRQAIAFGRDSWNSDFRDLDVTVTVSWNDYVTGCQVQSAVGCARYRNPGITEIQISLWPQMRVSDTALEHELRHVYLCVYGQCDAKHESPLWDIVIE